MTHNNDLALGKSEPWFKRWFNSNYYHQLYGTRDEREAADFIDTLMRELQPKPGSSMLDVGCGAGRHCRQLARKGHLVTGIDLAGSSIQEARRSESSSLHFFRHDMRKAFGKNRYDYIFNFFTSFGYFREQAENNMVIRNMAAALQPEGTLLLDYLNVAYAEERLVPSETKEIDGVVYRISRWTDEDYFFKKIVIHDPFSETDFENTEQVARFSLAAFQEMFASAGMHIEAEYGDYMLNSYKCRESPRLIMRVIKTAG